jgi:hypothetical protein
VGHQGGRFIWQLEGADTLLVGWRPTSDEDPGLVEAPMLAEFRDAYRMLPFATVLVDAASTPECTG